MIYGIGSFPFSQSCCNGNWSELLCHLPIRLKKYYDPPLGKSGLAALTKCDILQYVKVCNFQTVAYKVKVKSNQNQLKTIVEMPEGDYFMDIWKSRSTNQRYQKLHPRARTQLLWWLGPWRSVHGIARVFLTVVPTWIVSSWVDLMSSSSLSTGYGPTSCISWTKSIQTLKAMVRLMLGWWVVQMVGVLVA